MKTFIVNSLKEAVGIGKKLDSISQLQNKEWSVLTDEDGVKETFIFMKKGKLINSINGISSYFIWEYIPVNSSVLIENENSKMLYKIAVCDENLLVLNLDGTQEFCFLVNTTSSESKLLSYEDVQWYLIRKKDIDILNDKQKREYEEEKRKKEELRKIEMDKAQKEDKQEKKIVLFIVLVAILVFMLLIWTGNMK